MKLPVVLSLRPSERLLKLVLLLALWGLSLGCFRLFFEGVENLNFLISLSSFVCVGLVILVLYDGLNKVRQSDFDVDRKTPNSFALNRVQSIQFNIVNQTDRDIKVSLTDGVPEQFKGAVFPMVQIINKQQKGLFEYSVVPKQRGLSVFDKAYVLVTSKYGFWEFIYRLGPLTESKVYPDFSAISHSFIFGVEQAMRNMGAHIAKRKGEGMEFNQLREFREGDTLKQVDWKATAKVGMPISREYQEEKDQNVVFLLDCSRRMRAMDNNLSYFDYALNALLMSSYIALDKGDAVGVMTFSGEASWLPPIKGKNSINTVLNHLYDLETSTQSSDYVTAAEELLAKHRKRSLIVLITNVRDEDNEDLQKAVEILRKQHLIMVVALQERLLEQVDDMPVDDLDQAMLYAGTKHFEQSRKKMLALLKAQGVSVVDATHKNIHIQLVAEYLRLKQFGLI